ncbi:MAG: sugar transferase [Roseburia sp.]
MNKKKYSVLKHLDFLILDFFSVELCFFAACMVRKDTFISLMERYISMSCVLLFFFLLIVAFLTIYSGILRRNFVDEFHNVCTLAIYLFVALTVYCFVTKTSEDYSRAVLLTFLALVIPVLFLVRITRKEMLRKRRAKKGGEVLLFIREEDIERKIEQFTERASSGVIVSGIVTWEETATTEVQGIPIVACKENLCTYVENHRVDCVYIYLKDEPIHDYIDFLVRRNVLVYRALRNLEKSSFRYSVSDMNGYKTLCVRERELSIGFAFTKRLLDIMVSLFALIVFSPVILAVAIAIKLQDGGPVIYKSKRVGKGGNEFFIYKFRSMKLNADKLEDMLTPEELARYYKEFKLENDPRVTKVGAFIRKYSIDEVPQFFNILKGDMALIGPRPLVKKEVEINYPDDQDLLLSVKPGLTGYWQAYARNNVGYENGERQRMELYYIEHSCWKMDIRIIFRTAKMVLSGDGAQ